MNERVKTSDIVEMSDVSFAWPGRRQFRVNVKNLALAAGSRTLLVGPSGSGKTTLLSLICGIVIPDRGTVDVLGQEISALAASKRDRFRAEHIGVIFQMFNLLPYGSVLDNVILPLSFADERRRRVAAEGGERDAAQRLLTGLGLDDTLLEEPAAALSVGQQQRVAAARALIGSPELMVADEPTSALDQNNQKQFLDLLFGQLKERGATLLMVSHDERLASEFDTIVNLQDVVEVAP